MGVEDEDVSEGMEVSVYSAVAPELRDHHKTVVLT